MAIPTGPRPQRRSRRKSPDVETVKEGGTTLQSPGFEQQEKNSPTQGAGRPGRQALHPPGAHGRLRPRILTERVSAPASGFCYVAERRPQNFLSWSRLCFSTSQSLRGNLVAWPIRILGQDFANQNDTWVPASAGKLRPPPASPPPFAAHGATDQSVKAAPPLALLANRNAVPAAVSSEAFLWKPPLSPAATRSLSRDC